MLVSILHVVHLLTVVIWIGGLAFITILVLPMVIKMPDALQKVLFFQRIEKKFAPLARIYNLIVGATGFVMLFMLDAHKILFTKQGLSLTFMFVVWVFWAIMLFGLEPFIVKKMLERLSKSGEPMEIETVFARLNRMHWILLMLSLAAIAAGAGFTHGFF